MKIRGITFTAIAIALSFNIEAATVSLDWHSPRDNLITRDTKTGMDWLDLTVTHAMSYNSVISQLAFGGQFYGWRFATNTEVVGLWSNFDVDLNIGAISSSNIIDDNVLSAVSMLGNTLSQYNQDEYLGGVLGFTSVSNLETPGWMGAYIRDFLRPTRYHLERYSAMQPGDAIPNSGSYLIRSSFAQSTSSFQQVSVVPVPAAVWLFGSGLIGLVGFARRKKA